MVAAFCSENSHRQQQGLEFFVLGIVHLQQK